MKLSLKITLTFLLSLVLFFCTAAVSGSANDQYDPVPFIDENGTSRECNEYFNIYEISGSNLSGWYVADKDFTYNGRLEVTGDAKIILANGCTLTVKKGINVAENATLTIYGQTGNSGKLIANEDKKDKCAGIGGGNNQSCGTIKICGGTVIAYGGSDAAGIGGGNEPGNGNVNGVIIINGGSVTATGGKYGSGIGGGDLSDGGKITINGGTVKAYGGQEAAAIGGGDGDDSKYGNGGTITINGGNVTAESYEYSYNYDDQWLGAGIGGGVEGGSGTITITGGVVRATGHRGGAGIGSGVDGNKKSNKSLMGNKITITGGEVHGDTPVPRQVSTEYGGGAGIGSGRNSPGCDITISGGTVYASGSQKEIYDEDGGAGIGNSQHSKGGSVTITGGTIHAYSSCKEGSPIGKGANGNAPSCKLDYPGCKVWWENYTSPAEDRAQVAFGSQYYEMHIGPCNHADRTYHHDDNNHYFDCVYCGNRIEDPHEMKYENRGDQHEKLCGVCGYSEGMFDHEIDPDKEKCYCGARGVRIHFEANGGGGEMPDEIILKGKSYDLPQCGFTAPEAGLQFIGWSVSMYESDWLQLPGHGLYKPQETVTVTANWGDIWGSLQGAIDGAENGDVIVLNKNYKAGPDDVEYYVAPGKDVTIDLNGYTIDRALRTELHDPEEQGSVFRVEGSLTIIDSKRTGVIQGGSVALGSTAGATPVLNDQFGGAFTVDGGTLTIKGGTIQTCQGICGAVWLGNGAVFNLEGGTIRDTDGMGSIVCVSGGSTFNMSGGRICENELTNFITAQFDFGQACVYVKDGAFHTSGGSVIDNNGTAVISFSPYTTEPVSAVRIGENGSFFVSGSPVITRNGEISPILDNPVRIRNVYLASGQTIRVEGALSHMADIGISTENGSAGEAALVITSGFNGKGSCSAFSSDDGTLMIRVSPDHEAILAELTDVPVESVEIDPAELTLETGEVIIMNAVITPEDASVQDTFWLSENSGVASVGYQTGELTAVSEGQTVIHVYTTEALEAVCTVTVIAHEHDWQDATCTEPKTCRKCGETEGEALGHSESAPVLENESEAGCTEDGGYDEVVYCEICGEEISRTEVLVPATGHDYVAEVTEPTCNENGYITYTCSRCEDTYVFAPEDRQEHEGLLEGDIQLTALGHEWDGWTVVEEPTCTEEGTESRTCSRCGELETRTADALGHAYEDEVKEPTCTEGGFTTHTCSRCGDTYTDGETEALGHDFSEWTETTAPTCTEAGEEIRICSRCGEEETRVADALGHDLIHHDAQEATCTEAGWAAYDECARCDYTTYEEIPATGHDWGEWAVTKEPTTKEEGVNTRICKNDPSHTETEVLPVLTIYYEVSFQTAGLAEIEPQSILNDTKAVRPADPEASEESFSFEGWFKDAAFTEAWDFDQDIIEADTVIYAKWTHRHEDMVFTAWVDPEHMPSEGGNYVLTTDVAVGRMWVLNDGNEFNLCLHGHELKYVRNNPEVQSYAVMINGGAVLNLYDCEEEPGNICAEEGNGICVSANAVFNLYEGKVSGNRRFSNSSTSGYGVEIKKNGVFNMYGGEISDNSSTGVYLSSGGTFNMHGGLITGNGGADQAVHGSGVHIMGGGTMNMSAGTITNNKVSASNMYRGGGVQVESGSFHIVAAEDGSGKTGTINITNNKNYWGWPGNVDVYNRSTVTNKVVFVDAELSEDSRIGIWSYQEPETQVKSRFEIVVTKGLGGKGSLDQFFCDRPYETAMTDKYYPYKMTVNDAGEAAIRCVHLIALDANGGTGEMDTLEAIAGYYELPECEFTAPEGKEFDVWRTMIGDYPAGGRVYMDRDLTGRLSAKAVWKDKASFTVTFVTKEGSPVDPQKVYEGGTAVRPETDPEGDSGTVFGGWFKDEALTEEYDFSAAVTSDITLYAKWDEAPENEPAEAPENTEGENEESGTEPEAEAAPEDTEPAAEEPSEAVTEESPAEEEAAPASEDTAEPVSEEVTEPAVEEVTEGSADEGDRAPADVESPEDAPSESGSTFGGGWIAALIAFLVLAAGAVAAFIVRKKKQ